MSWWSDFTAWLGAHQEAIATGSAAFAAAMAALAVFLAWRALVAARLASVGEERIATHLEGILTETVRGRELAALQQVSTCVFAAHDAIDKNVVGHMPTSLYDTARANLQSAIAAVPGVDLPKCRQLMQTKSTVDAAKLVDDAEHEIRAALGNSRELLLTAGLSFTGSVHRTAGRQKATLRRKWVSRIMRR